MVEHHDAEHTIEAYLVRLRRHIATEPGETSALIDEVRDHLWEATERYRDPHAAIAAFGDPESIGTKLSDERALGMLEVIATRFARGSLVLTVAVVVAIRFGLALNGGVRLGVLDTLAIVGSGVAIAAALALSTWSAISSRSLAAGTDRVRSVVIACAASAGCAWVGVFSVLGYGGDVAGDAHGRSTVLAPIFTGTLTIVLAIALVIGLPVLRRLWRCRALFSALSGGA
jgi:hypothetical protein